MENRTKRPTKLQLNTVAESKLAEQIHSLPKLQLKLSKTDPECKKIRKTKAKMNKNVT